MGFLRRRKEHREEKERERQHEKELGYTDSARRVDDIDRHMPGLDEADEVGDPASGVPVTDPMAWEGDLDDRD